jgi:hypothetical protein
VWSPKKKRMIHQEIDWPELDFYSPERNAYIGKRRYNIKWWKRRAHKDERRLAREALAKGRITSLPAGDTLGT